MAHIAPNLYELMGKAKKGQLVLPNFQRRFIWYRQQIEELLESVIAGYFMGTFLFLNVRPNDAPFSPLLLEGVDEVIDNVELEPEFMILDGQQRITSLFYALYRTELPLKGTKYPYRFYLDLRKARSGQFDEAVFSTRWDHYEDPDKQFENAVVPFTGLASLESFEGWLRGYQNYWEDSRGRNLEEEDDFRRIREAIGTYQMEVISLSQNEYKTSDIVEIFERVNSMGTALSVFELLTSRFYKPEINLNLREMWEKCFDESELIKHFSGEITNEKFPRYILQIIALMRGINPKKKNLFDLSINDFQRDWEVSSAFLEESFKRLNSIKKGGYGVRKDWVPYATMIPPLAVLLWEIENRRGAANYYNKLHKWYWASVFSNWYERSTDTRAFNDVKEVTSWFDNDEEVPTVINSLDYGEIELQERAQKSGAIYQGIISLILLKGATDFFLDDTIELHELDDHHIFPIAYLKEKDVAGDGINNILNRTLIASRTNRRISKKAPSVYVEEMKGALGSESKVKEVLKTHYINNKAYEAMQEDDYDKFLGARDEELLKEIKRRITF